jgi:hypothetical protein
VQDTYKPAHPGYFHIPRGVFILAALYKGYRVTRMRGSMDAWISVPGLGEGCRDTFFGVCSGTYPYLQKEDIRYD